MATKKKGGKKKLGFFALLVLAIAALLGHFQFDFFGLNKKNEEKTKDGETIASSSASSESAAEKPCQLRVSKDAITVDGTQATIKTAVQRCLATDGANLLIVGDARLGTVQELRMALQVANVKVFEKTPTPDTDNASSAASSADNTGTSSSATNSSATSEAGETASAPATSSATSATASPPAASSASSAPADP